MAKVATIVFFLLIIFGLVMLASAGVVEGQKKFGDSSYYFTHQLLYGVLPGLALFFIFSHVPSKFWKKGAFLILLVAVGLLVLVFVPQFGFAVKGAQRWLDLGWFTVQPSEFLKLALIMYLSAWFASRERKQSHSLSALIPFFLVLGFVAFLLLLQPDFGTLSIVVLIGIALYFFSGAHLKHFVILMLILVLLFGALSVAAPYRFNRIKTFFNPQQDRQGTSYHINQALISIGSGGVFGVGYGQSKQKLAYLPEPVGDSIFAVLVEELGLVGALVLLGLFLMLMLSLVRIAQQTPDAFGRLFVLGVAVWIGGQAFTNIAAISGIIPLTGVPLPLISFGSSSLVSLMIAMGIVRNVARGG